MCALSSKQLNLLAQADYEDYSYSPAYSKVPQSYQIVSSKHDEYGSAGHGYGKKKDECCELVVDPLTLLALLGGILGGTFFLNMAITMNIMGKRRRRRRRSPVSSRKSLPLSSSDTLSERFQDALNEGKTAPQNGHQLTNG